MNASGAGSAFLKAGKHVLMEKPMTVDVVCTSLLPPFSLSGSAVLKYALCSSPSPPPCLLIAVWPFCRPRQDSWQPKQPRRLQN
jgi:hypothetical protein